MQIQVSVVMVKEPKSLVALGFCSKDKKWGKKHVTHAELHLCTGNLRVPGPITLLILFSKSWDLEGSSLGPLWMYSITQTLRRTFRPFSRATRNLSGGSYAGPARVLFVLYSDSIVCTQIVCV